MTEQVELVGGPAAMADLRRWAHQVAPAVDKATRPFADRVADQVRGRVPVVSGRLAGSVGVDAQGDDGVVVSLGGGVPYAGWIEFGGSRGRPLVPEGRYLFPTAKENEDEYADVVAHAADETVSRFAWSTPA